MTVVRDDVVTSVAPSRRAVVVKVVPALVMGAAAVGGVLLAGCSAMGGFGLPSVPPGSIPGPREVLVGTLHVEDNGCFTWSGPGSERRWVVWPRNAEQDDVFVLLGDGTAVTDGDTLTGTGIRADADVLPAWDNRDSQIGAHGRFCDADDRGIVVFDEVARADSD